jgi:hypothetical protein
MGGQAWQLGRLGRLGFATAITVATVAALGCDDLTITTLQFTTWGGSHIGLVISVTGGTVEYDCAEGEILEPISITNGKFNVLGLHYMGMGGPIGVDKANPRPARYEGTVKGDQMTMTVTLTDTKEQVGTFQLVRGENPHVLKCL